MRSALVASRTSMKNAMNAPVNSSIAPTNNRAIVNARPASKNAFANNVTTTKATMTAETTHSEIAAFN